MLCVSSNPFLVNQVISERWAYMRVLVMFLCVFIRQNGHGRRAIMYFGLETQLVCSGVSRTRCCIMPFLAAIFPLLLWCDLQYRGSDVPFQVLQRGYLGSKCVLKVSKMRPIGLSLLIFLPLLFFTVVFTQNPWHPGLGTASKLSAPLSLPYCCH